MLVIWLSNMYFPFYELNHTDEMSLIISSSNYVTYFHNHYHHLRGKCHLTILVNSYIYIDVIY